MYLNLFSIIIFQKRLGTSFEKYMTPLHQTILCAKFDSNLPHRSQEKVENEKSLQPNRQMTDKNVIKKAHLNLRFGKVIRCNGFCIHERP